MPVSGQEIASLDFANLIGGPLDAVIRAQAKSAIATAQFIKEVGFDKNGKVVNADFSYVKNDDGAQRKFSLQVPFLSMIPVPYIMVTDALIEFTAKISSTTQSEASTNTMSSGSFSAKADFWFASASVSGKASSQKNTKRTDSEQRTFDMKIIVRAKNADIPAGTERILTMIEQSMKENPNPDKLVAYYKILSINDSGTEALLETENVADLQKAIKTDSVIFQYEDPENPNAKWVAKASGGNGTVDSQNPNAVKVALTAYTATTGTSVAEKEKMRQACTGKYLSLPIPK